MNATTKPSGRPHTDGCPKPGYRYGATIRSTKATRADGTAGLITMFCKNAACLGTKIV